MLKRENGRSGGGKASDYPLALPSDPLLIDEPGHQWDIVTAVENAAKVVFHDPDAMLAQFEQVLGKDLREHFRRQFFREHLGRYSKSGRKAPIYWQLTVPSRNWSVWLYAPSISREQLYAVGREGRRKATGLLESVQRMRAEHSRAAGRDRRRIAERLAADEELAQELTGFRSEIERIAESGWEPDLDDGIILCAAPLAELFPGWSDLVKERESIRKDEYPWATVSRWAKAL